MRSFVISSILEAWQRAAIAPLSIIRPPVPSPH